MNPTTKHAEKEQKREAEMAVYDAALRILCAMEDRWAVEHRDGKRGASATPEVIASEIDAIMPDLRAAIHHLYPHYLSEDLEDTEIERTVKAAMARKLMPAADSFILSHETDQ